VTIMKREAELVKTLKDASEQFRSPCFSSSLSIEDMVITDIIARHELPVEVFSIDTGRLPDETYQLMQVIREQYVIPFSIYAPSSSDLEVFVNANGPNAFYQSINYRKLCCQIRKVVPLKRALENKDLWVTGLRKQQSVTRTELPLFEWDELFGIKKCNPLLDWSLDEVWEYISLYNVPYNALHDKGFPSIGCAPCTRAVEKGEDLRAGRWWWESPDSKECGLHGKNAKISQEA